MRGNKLFMVKIGTMYVRHASKMFDEIQLDADPKWARKIEEREKDFILEHFPNAEVRSFDVVETSNGGW